jgi:hypothetical protein
MNSRGGAHGWRRVTATSKSGEGADWLDRTVGVRTINKLTLACSRTPSLVLDQHRCSAQQAAAPGVHQKNCRLPAVFDTAMILVTRVKVCACSPHARTLLLLKRLPLDHAGAELEG